jgi:excisionase family DNA binding protein
VTVPARDGHGRNLLSADQLAELLGRDRRWVYRQHERGMPAIRLGRELCFRADAVEAWLASQRVGDWRDDEAA